MSGTLAPSESASALAVGLNLEAVDAQGAQAQGLQLDEATCIRLVVEPLVVLKRGNDLVVEGVGRLAAQHDDVALVQLQLHSTCAVLLGLVNEGLQRLPLGAEPEAIVDELSIAGHQLILEVRLLAVQGDGLNGAVGIQQDGAAGGLVHSSALHSHKAALHQVHTPDAVVAAQLVELSQQGGGAHLDAVNGHGVTLLKLNLQKGGGVWGLLRGHTACEHVLCGGHPRVLQGIALVADVQQVGVHGVGGLATLGLGHGDAVLLCILNQLGA
mmetsp:Transcript_21925/g.47855  ORF Transcript_21925/g.47855 Transcript_21925/m.47855 type:complete len:270 (+) Transcript_21925:619-1428(+)